MPARVFVAIELPASARDLLSDATAAFIAADPSWAEEKPVAARLLHITVAFLGHVPDPELPGLLERLRPAVAGIEPFELRVTGIRAIPSPRRAAMLWATLTGETDDAAELAAAIARTAGLSSGTRPFRPHITLARARRPRHAPPSAVASAAAALSGPGKDMDGIVSVRCTTVFSSTLSGNGPTYERLAELVLGTGAAIPRID